MRVLYGGSATAKNVEEILGPVDGALVGGASLDAEQFAVLSAIAAGGPAVGGLSVAVQATANPDGRPEAIVKRSDGVPSKTPGRPWRGTNSLRLTLASASGTDQTSKSEIGSCRTAMLFAVHRIPREG